MIRGHGSAAAKIAIVGDIASEADVKNNHALTGGAESLLASLLKSTGANIKLDECYRTVLVKQQVPGYFSKNKKTKKEALGHLDTALWGKILCEELEPLKHLNVIFALGEIPLNVITNEKGVHNFRGSILPIAHLDAAKLSKTIKVIPSVHPREVFAKEDNRLLLQFDLQRVIKYSNVNTFPDPGITPWVCKTYSAFQEWWKRAKNAKNKKWPDVDPFLTVDIETYYNYITCIGLCGDGKEGISVPLTDSTMNIMDRVMLMKAMDEIFRSGYPLVNQNIKYDWTITDLWGYGFNNIAGDTMLAAHTCYPELLKNLGFLTSIHTEIPYYKDEGKEFNPRLHSFSQLLLYNAKDAITAWQIWANQQKEMEELNVKHFYFNFVNKLIPAYRRIDDRGINIDHKRVQELHSKYSNYYTMYHNFIKSATGVNVNINSNEQVGNLIYNILNCPKHTHTTDTGKEAFDCDEETIEGIYLNEVSNTGVIAVLKSVVAARKLAKICGWLKFNVSQSTGKFHTQVKLQGTKSGRTSNDFHTVKNILLDEKGHLIQQECGGPLQTVPKHGFEHDGMVYGADLRSIFVPTPGYAFVEGDSAQGEARIVCVLAQDYSTLELMDKDDLHIITAAITKQCARAELEALRGSPKGLDELRRIREEFGKRPRHAGNYDMGAYRLSIMIHKAIAVCEEILARFHEFSPKLRLVFHQEIQNALNKAGLLISPQGRRRDFFGKLNHKTFKEAYSWIPQATLSDNTKQTILDLQEYFDNKYGRKHDKMFILGESHDSLFAEVRLEHVDEYVEIFKASMERRINFLNCTLSRDFDLVIPVDIGVSTNSWYAKDFKKWRGSFEASIAA